MPTDVETKQKKSGGARAGCRRRFALDASRTHSTGAQERVRHWLVVYRYKLSLYTHIYIRNLSFCGKSLMTRPINQPRPVTSPLCIQDDQGDTVDESNGLSLLFYTNHRDTNAQILRLWSYPTTVYTFKWYWLRGDLFIYSFQTVCWWWMNRVCLQLTSPYLIREKQINTKIFLLEAFFFLV